MPIYEYCCEDCGHIFEEWQSGFEERHFPCPICTGDSKRIVSHTSFVLKGSGWYVTDYCNKHTSPNASPNASGNGGKEKDSKPAKTDTASASAAPASGNSAASSTTS
jgi:putative FmdB family regulatory protein